MFRSGSQALNFNSHAHVERDTDLCPCHKDKYHFNSHAHVERDFSASSKLPSSMNFNSHAHVERDDAEFKALPSDSDFNSHAHVERDAKTCADSTTADISTHTLTWSVTVMNTQAPLVYCISTHTLTWSVTLCNCERLDRLQHFNSHAHVERDVIVIRSPCKSKISTHTLTWSVTPTFHEVPQSLTFQLTRSRGA